MKAVYLLPCSCGKKVPVDAGQAGAKIACDCGQQLTVPTFRALRNLEQEVPVAAVAAQVAKGAGWSARRGLMFSCGLLVSLIAAVLICYHLFVYINVRDGGERWKQAHLEGLQHGVEHLAPVEMLAEFQDLASKGMTLDGVPPWANISTVRDSSIRALIAESIALAVGLISLVASLMGVRRSKVK